MNSLSRSFQQHIGKRGCHFYDNSTCNFLDWKEVLQFASSLSKEKSSQIFSEKLLEVLSNYNPDKEFLAVHQVDETVTVELFASSRQIFQNER